jgi:predicted nuclease with TOPRIM domain
MDFNKLIETDPYGELIYGAEGLINEAKRLMDTEKNLKAALSLAHSAIEKLEERNSELERENSQLLAALHEAQGDIERWTAKFENNNKGE